MVPLVPRFSGCLPAADAITHAWRTRTGPQPFSPHRHKPTSHPADKSRVETRTPNCNREEVGTHPAETAVTSRQQNRSRFLSPPWRSWCQGHHLDSYNADCWSNTFLGEQVVTIFLVACPPAEAEIKESGGPIYYFFPVFSYFNIFLRMLVVL